VELLVKLDCAKRASGLVPLNGAVAHIVAAGQNSSITKLTDRSPLTSVSDLLPFRMFKAAVKVRDILPLASSAEPSFKGGPDVVT
jgi:hypothetical protein